MKSIALLCVLLVDVAVCGDQFTTVNLNTDFANSEEVTLSCEYSADLAENDTLVWRYETPIDTTTLEGNSKTRNITADAKAGNYSCVINGVVRSSTLVIKLGEPHFVNVRTSVTYNNGDANRKLTCESAGSYPDPTFSWHRKETDNENEAHLVVSSETKSTYEVVNNGTKSTLTFYNVTYSEDAIFLCSVVNMAGNATVEVVVRVKDKYAAVWPFLGIVAEVVILIIIIFAYERHSKKAELKKDVVISPEEEKPLNRDEGMEIRNRRIELKT